MLENIERIKKSRPQVVGSRTLCAAALRATYDYSCTSLLLIKKALAGPMAFAIHLRITGLAVFYENTILQSTIKILGLYG